ncbi:MAG: NADH:ubiquinone reductase (Na(+)-transporting) subunit B, partial [Spirochaetota bacterium]|nr:NADH:ubiquinone reductase (Na(+)-transporting) subunit B [Spirochaetota bacterium]
YNVGFQAHKAKGLVVGVLDAFYSGFLTTLPVILVSYIVGGFWELVFSVVRRHEISEGFLVTGILFALVLPPTIPLWQVAMGVTFGVVIGKEVFGGTGMNIMNPALTGRAFIFFAYPSQISGDSVWVAVDYAKDKLVDGFSGSTPLSVIANNEIKGKSAEAILLDSGYSFEDMFYGFIPGSFGETSSLAILIGAAILLVTRIASWRVMLSVVLGGVSMALLMNMLAGKGSPAMFSLAPHWHLLMGGFMFGMVFMATDPVTAASTNTGKWIYGFLIGVLAILIRVLNPAYPEGIMLSILFMNIFAPLIDYYVVKANIRRRLRRARHA